MEYSLENYDYYLVQFSGGKDSTAAFLHLLEQGIPIKKIELWHQLVDGAPGSKPFMDWACTEDYCRKFAKHFNVPIYFMWREGGFKQEMLRNNTATGKTTFEVPGYAEHPQIGIRQDFNAKHPNKMTIGGKGKPGTRLKFPQVSANLRVRWCSSYLKKDIQESALKNQDRFKGHRTLVITGERAQESANRAKYVPFKQDRCYTTWRNVDHVMPIHNWSERQVWQKLASYRIQVHPCYYLGYSRCSCQFCIFGDANQFLTSTYISFNRGNEIMNYEKEFGVTIKRDKSLLQLMETDGAHPYEQVHLTDFREQSDRAEYTMPIICTPWILPAGAYQKNVGPT